MKNLSKKHLKQIYNRRNSFAVPTIALSKFFRAAPNNRSDYKKMMDWRWSMCTNVRYMIPEEKIKRGKKSKLRYEALIKSYYSISEGFAELGTMLLNVTVSMNNFITNFGGRTND